MFFLTRKFSGLRPLLAACATLLFLTSPLVLTTKNAHGKKKSRRPKISTACSIAYLPFVTGRSWTYQYVIPPGVEDRPGALKAKVPETFNITVKKVIREGSETTIVLNESYRDVSRETVLHCGPSGLSVPLESFFFAGELGGGLGIDRSNVSRKGDTFPKAGGLRRGTSLYIEVTAKVERASTAGSSVEHAPAKLEIERQITVGASEDVEVEHGIHRATAVQVAVSGRSALLKTPEKKVSLPETRAMLWFSSGIGLVRAYNGLGQGWELRDFKDAEEGNDISQ